MPLDWSMVIEKYGNGAKVPTVTGGKFLQVAGADEKAIYIESPIWSATLDRGNLEKGVSLIEEGLISRDPACLSRITCSMWRINGPLLSRIFCVIWDFLT